MALSKFTDYGSANCSWHNSGEKLRNTFARFALPMVWDYCEVSPLAGTTGGFAASVEWFPERSNIWIGRRAERRSRSCCNDLPPSHCGTEATPADGFDIICTDPPYYDAIPYSDLMDFFHVWLRRTLHGLSPETDAVLAPSLGPKWDAGANDGELVDQPGRFGGDASASREAYEDGMFRTFGIAMTLLRTMDAWWWCSPTSNPRRGERWCPP